MCDVLLELQSLQPKRMHMLNFIFHGELQYELEVKLQNTSETIQ